MTNADTARARPNDQFGFPIGTRWIKCTALDADGNRMGSATADVLNFPDTAHANSACVGALVRKYGAAMDTYRCTWGD